MPVPSRIQLFQRNSVAKMERVLRRPLGRAFSSKILGMKVKSCKQHSPKSPRGVPDGPTSPATWCQHSPNITPRWANMAPSRWANIVPRWANIEVQGPFLQCPSQAAAKFRRKKCFAGTVMRPRWPLGRAFLESILNMTPKQFKWTS